MYRPIDEMQEMRERRGFTPEFVAKVRERRAAEATAAEIAAREAEIIANNIKVIRGVGRIRMPLWAAQIVMDVAGKHGIEPVHIISKSRTVAHVRARNEAYHEIRAAKGHTAPSFPRMGDWFNRDHTGIIWGCARHAQMNGLRSQTRMNIEQKLFNHRRWFERKAA